MGELRAMEGVNRKMGVTPAREGANLKIEG